MRELDLLFEKFLLSGLTSLSNDDLDSLEQLLGQADQDILAWLTSATEPDDSEFCRIVTILRSKIDSQSNADA
jgi:succinate dehydrogenase flavin-adding protein (antitoxin of CptAB toxin-antitoxin module)